MHQVDTFWTGKIERNTIKIFLDRFEVTTKSYYECAHKKHYFSPFWSFLAGEKRAILLIFISSCAAMFSKYMHKFWLIAHRIKLVKIKKNLFFGPIFGRKIGFSQF